MPFTLAVITDVGNVFGTDVDQKQLARVFQFAGGNRIGFNPQDRFMLAMSTGGAIPTRRLAVITNSGDVFGAEITEGTLEPVFQFSGAKIGFNPQDRFMVALNAPGVGNRLAVITQSGDVFGADVVGQNIEPVFHFSGAKIGFNPQDRFMVALDPIPIH